MTATRRLGWLLLVARASADWQAGHDADPDSVQGMWRQWAETGRPDNGVARDVDGAFKKRPATQQCSIPGGSENTKCSCTVNFYQAGV